MKAVVGGQAYSSGVQNYSIKPKERIDDGEAAFEGSPWENLKFNEGEKITSVKLVQEGAGLSIFYNLQVYNGVPITVDSRGADFLTFVVDFSGLSTIDTYNNFFYLPSVFVGISARKTNIFVKVFFNSHLLLYSPSILICCCFAQEQDKFGDYNQQIKAAGNCQKCVPRICCILAVMP